MKKYAFFLAAFLLLGTSVTFAQKTRNDHTYSTHNYKHPNKAAEARRWEEQANPAQPLTRRGTLANETGPQSAANYKAQNRRPATGIVVDAPAVPEYLVKNPTASPRNYKHQSPYVEPQSQLARQRNKDKRDPNRTAVGE